MKVPLRRIVDFERVLVPYQGTTAYQCGPGWGDERGTFEKHANHFPVCVSTMRKTFLCQEWPIHTRVSYLRYAFAASRPAATDSHRDSVSDTPLTDGLQSSRNPPVITEKNEEGEGDLGGAGKEGGG